LRRVYYRDKHEHRHAHISCRPRVGCPLRSWLDDDRVCPVMGRAAVAGKRANQGSDGLMISEFVPLQMKRRAVETRLVIEDQGTEVKRTDPALLMAVARGHRWSRETRLGKRGIHHRDRQAGGPQRQLCQAANPAGVALASDRGSYLCRAPADRSYGREAEARRLSAACVGRAAARAWPAVAA
jgi:hypothetical protein